jgi:hypothetical protein
VALLTAENDAVQESSSSALDRSAGFVVGSTLGLLVLG